MRLYHGSQVESFVPTFGLGDDTHDYGYDVVRGWRADASKHPYDKVYLPEVIEEQGKLFERLQDAPEPIDSADFITAFMHGYTRRQLDEGHAYYLTLDAERKPNMKRQMVSIAAAGATKQLYAVW